MGEGQVKRILTEEIVKDKIMINVKDNVTTSDYDKKLEAGKVIIEQVHITYNFQDEVIVKVKVYNETDFKVKEEVQLYIKDLNSIYATCRPVLCACKEIELDAKQGEIVEIKILPEAFMIIDEKGYRYRDSNEFEVYIAINSINFKNKKTVEENSIIRKIRFRSILEEG